MIKEDKFDAWLVPIAPSKKRRSDRVSAVRTIEDKLGELGVRHKDLDEAWEDDRFKALFGRLEKMKDNARAGGQDYQILLTTSSPLPSWINWLEKYGQFLAKIPPAKSEYHDRIQQHVLEKYINPAHEEGRKHVDVLVRDVNWDLNMDEAWPSVCNALKKDDFLQEAKVSESERIGADMSPTTVFRFKFGPETVADRSVFEERGTTNAETKEEPLPMNLILYGPPGTGKTYATAKEAVELCGEKPTEDRRAEWMKIYKRLVADGRIVFVTFHQSMSYEDFVEGLRPTTKPEKNGGEGSKEEATSAGFRLKSIPGIFRRIAEEATAHQGSPSGGDPIRLEGRRFFKMSIGKNKPSEERWFKKAIKEGCTLFGDEQDDIDWSDKKFESREEIFKALEANDTEDVKNENSNRVGMIDSFRNEFRKGDVIIAAKGRKAFHAIGEIIGDYEYRPQGNQRVFSHQRKVNWLWVERSGKGKPVKGNIFDRIFGMLTIHFLDDKLRIPVLERYINSQRAEGASEPEPFVLIIDEINRANISKVFGELITLLEPDKRLGQENELKVRLPYSRDEFGMPSNLHILGTMNTADRSIALLDVALRRRFKFREMMPDASLLAEASGKCGIDLKRLLEIINERIEYLYDREHQIGHAYFMGCKSRGDVDDVMRDKVIPLLAEYFFEDWAKIAIVLGDAVSEGDIEAQDGEEVEDRKIEGDFLNCWVLKAPQGFGDGDATPRLRWRARSEEEGFTYDNLLKNNKSQENK